MCKQCDDTKMMFKKLIYPASSEWWTEKNTMFHGEDGLFHTVTNWSCSNGHKWTTETTHKPPYDEVMHGLDNLNEEK